MLFVIFFVHFRLEKIYFFYIIITGYLIVLTFIDIDKRTVPDTVVVYIFVTGAIFSIFEIKANVFDSLIGAVTGGGIILILNFFSNGKIGEGDVKLIAALGFALGAQQVLSLIAYAFLAGGAFAVILLATGKAKRSDGIAFVPFIAIGFLLSALLQRP